MTDPSRPAAPAPIEIRPAPLPPPPTAAASAGELPPIPYPGSTPRAGELTKGWRIITFLTWIAVLLALATVWSVSVQLGLSTWWLGPRSQPQPLTVQLSPFVGPLLMVLGTINQVRWLGWWGLVASGVIAGFGFADLATVGSIATVELLIAGLAAAVSIASLTGTYRRDKSATQVIG